MSYLSIEGGAPLHGELTIQGSKNSVLPVLAATILARGDRAADGDGGDFAVS